MQKGSQKICLEAPGQHELHFVNPCIKFGDAPHLFDTRSPEVYLIHHAPSFSVNFELLVKIYIFVFPLAWFCLWVSLVEFSSN